MTPSFPEPFIPAHAPSMLVSEAGDTCSLGLASGGMQMGSPPPPRAHSKGPRAHAGSLLKKDGHAVHHPELGQGSFSTG
jgi:hypothetical protein